MKKNLFFALCFGLFLFSSCKKEQQTSPSSIAKSTVKKYAVEIKLSDFEQSIGSISKSAGISLMSLSNKVSADSLKNHINNLVYLAYDSAGKEVGRIRQYSSGGGYRYNYVFDPYVEPYEGYNNSFGSIIDSLPSGKYTVVLVGSNYRFTINERNPYDPNGDMGDRYLLPDAYIGELSSLSYEIPFTEDTFIKKFFITINNQSLNQAVALDRITGKLEVNILDAIPANADKFDFKIYKAATGIHLSSLNLTGYTNYGYGDGNGGGEGDTPEFPESTLWDPIKIKDSEKGVSNYQYSRFLYGRDDVPVTVKLRCFDAQGNIIVSKTVENVRIYKNKRTILTGRLFDNRSEASFNVSVNSAWDPNTVEVPF